MCLVPHLLGLLVAHVRARLRGETAYEALPSGDAEVVPAETEQQPPPPETTKRKILRLAVFGLPAACDACATTMLNVGLILTSASVFQMLRGTVVLFAGERALSSYSHERLAFLCPPSDCASILSVCVIGRRRRCFPQVC